MPPSLHPRSRAWLLSIAYGVFAYALHKTGAHLGYYPRFWWFQMVTHFVSASALALLLYQAGQTLSLEGGTLVGVVIVLSLLGAVGWELVEYLGVFPDLHWWGPADSLLDMTMNVVGIGSVITVIRARRAHPIDPAPRHDRGVPTPED